MFFSQKKQSIRLSPQIKSFQTNKSIIISQNIRKTQQEDNIRYTKSSQRDPIIQTSLSNKNHNSVLTIYSELHQYIESVEQKIQYLLQRQSNEYKVVYQHYYKKFKDELHELKEKTLDQQKKIIQNQHVAFIESQLKILKQEVIAYKSSYEKTKKQNDQLKAAIDFLKKDVAFLQNNVKNRLKQIKLLNSEIQKLESKFSLENVKKTEQSKINYQKQRDLKKRSHSMDIESLYGPEVKIQFHKYKPNPIYKQLVSTRNIYEDYFFTDHSTKQNKTTSFRSMTVKSNQSIKDRIKYTNIPSTPKQMKYLHTQISEKASKNLKSFNISQWFMDCVESVNKEIIFRKSLNPSFQPCRIQSQFLYLNSLQNFMKLDKMKILTIFVSSEEVISMIYHVLRNQKSLPIKQNHQINQFEKSKQKTKGSDKKEVSQTQDRQTKFTNQKLRRDSNRRILNKTTMQGQSLDWSMIDKIDKFRNLSQFRTTKNVSQGFNKGKIKKDTKDDSNLSQDQQIDKKNVKIMKKITAIINNKKNMRLSTQLFVRKKNFIIE